MFKIYFPQQWFGFSDPGLEGAFYHSPAPCAFCGLSVAWDPIPDETTLLKFRHLLERHGLTRLLFETVSRRRADAGALRKGGAIMDVVTPSTAPASTKNAARRRDPAMRQTKQGDR